MAIDNYCVNLSTRQWLRAFDQPNPIATPVWAHGDVKAITVTFVRSAPGSAVQVVDSIVSAQLAIGTPGSPPATSATAGTAVYNAHPFTVALNLSAISTLINGSATPVQSYLEFRLTDATGPNRYKLPIRLEQYLISDTLVDPSPPERGLGANEASGIYVPKEWPAGMRMIVTDDNGQRWAVYPGTDRQFHFDPI